MRKLACLIIVLALMIIAPAPIVAVAPIVLQICSDDTGAGPVACTGTAGTDVGSTEYVIANAKPRLFDGGYG
jgi:hypothetical protein